MLIKCKNEIYSPKNPFIEHSQLVRDICEDLGATDEAIHIPSRYYDLTDTILEPFDTIKYLLATNEFVNDNKELIDAVPCAQYFQQIDFHTIISNQLESRLQMFEFCNFLSADILKTLAYEIGYIAERFNKPIETIPELIEMIKREYPPFVRLYTKPELTKCNVDYDSSDINLIMSQRSIELDIMKMSYLLGDKERVKEFSCRQIQKECHKWKISKICALGNYDYIKYLCDIGYNWTVTDLQDGLYNAFGSKSLMLVKLLFSIIKEIENTTGHAITISPENIKDKLFKRENIEMLEYFLSIIPTDEKNLRLEACKKNNLPILKYLLSRNKEEYEEYDLLYVTCVNGYISGDMVSYLKTFDIKLEHKPNLFNVALVKGNIGLVKYLAKTGTQHINLLSKDVQFLNKVEIPRHMVKYGYKFSEENKLSMMKMYIKNGNLEGCQFILDQNIDIKVEDDILFYYAIVNHANEHFVEIFNLILDSMDGKIPTFADMTFSNRNIITKFSREGVFFENNNLIQYILTSDTTNLKNFMKAYKNVFDYDDAVYNKYEIIMDYIKSARFKNTYVK